MKKVMDEMQPRPTKVSREPDRILAKGGKQESCRYFGQLFVINDFLVTLAEKFCCFSGISAEVKTVFWDSGEIT